MTHLYEAQTPGPRLFYDKSCLSVQTFLFEFKIESEIFSRLIIKPRTIWLKSMSKVKEKNC